MRSLLCVGSVALSALVALMASTGWAIDFRQVTSFTTDINGIESPAWSPNGSRLAFSYTYWGPIYEIIGSVGIVRVTDGASESFFSGNRACRYTASPDWSPSGEQIVFVCREPCMARCWNDGPVVLGSVTEPGNVQLSAVGSDNPSWSPDGTLIAFDSDRSGNSDIWLVRVANQALAQVTTDPSWDIDPDWSPDGSQIAFVSGRSGLSNLWIASDLNTTQVTAATWTQVKFMYRRAR